MLVFCYIAEVSGSFSDHSMEIRSLESFSFKKTSQLCHTEGWGLLTSGTVREYQTVVALFASEDQVFLAHLRRKDSYLVNHSVAQ